MKIPPLFRITVILLLAGIWACSGSSEVQDTDSSGDSIDREAIYWARKDSAKMQFVEADVKFMIKMIGHHAQALVMSRLAPDHARSEQVKTLAARIINAQKDEIRTMQQWLRERNQPVPKIHIDGLDLTITNTGKYHMDHTKMAGMLSQAQLEELANAYGRKFDRLFLKYMIQHHSGAITMVEKLISTEGAAREDAAFKLASSINVDQQTEIERMQRMLKGLTTADK